MAVNGTTLDNAEVTYCYELIGVQRRLLPWTKVVFGDAGEWGVVPIPSAVDTNGAASKFPQTARYAFEEVMPNAPFPIGQPIHFFGGM